MEISLAKMYSAEKAVEVVANAIKIFGSHRIQQGDLDDLMMTSLAGTIAGGTEEMHREVIYQGMYRQYRRLRGRLRERTSPLLES